jgi:hypothetical protein
VPLILEDLDDDPDHEQVVGVGEEAHARDDHDLHLKPVDLRIVERLECARCGGGGVGHEASIRGARRPQVSIL